MGELLAKSLMEARSLGFEGEGSGPTPRIVDHVNVVLYADARGALSCVELSIIRIQYIPCSVRVT